MKYSDLSKRRKAMVDLIVEMVPSVKTDRCIAFADLTDLWHNKIKPRRIAGEKLPGYPLWLTIEPEFRTNTRGVYIVPIDDTEAAYTIPASKVKKVKTKPEKKPKVKLTPKSNQSIIIDTEKKEIEDSIEADLAAFANV